MKSYRKEVEKFLERYGDARSISLLEKERSVIASNLFEFFSLLCFPSTEERFLEGLKGKALHYLWNVVMSDLIQCPLESKTFISDSLQVCVKFRKGLHYDGETEPGEILHDFMQQFYKLPSGPNKKICKDLLFLDLSKALNGFEWKAVIFENDMMSTLCEYIEFGTATADLRIFLDIDVAIYPYNLSIGAIGDLRRAYKWFSLAFALCSDMADLEQAYFVEKSLNAVILYGQERGVLPKDIFRTERKYREQLYEKTIPSLMDEVECKGREYLYRSLECLKRIDEVDMSSMARAFQAVFKTYIEKCKFSSISQSPGSGY